MAAETRSLDCPKCGAPLDWSGDVEVIECAYCEGHITVASKKLTRDAAQERARAGPPPERPPAGDGAQWWSRASRRTKGLVIGGSAGAGAGVGGLAGGKKGALIGAAIGGGAASIYEAVKRK